ncbi:Putative glycoside hydrolase, family 28, pectin lyase/virulence factor [Septoria linicola]|uniref:endo-polygalacturonase n=1 Tax=Septoria linicola TaxID=215465 RepID=A0A9Q9AXR5_9PEZI|nr:Putative glycoside hydrolase, family 28, pectin lyase/virulence factor [Septoria linicola]
MQKTFTSLLLGAGLAAARPAAPWFAQGHRHHGDHSPEPYSFPSFSGSPATGIFPVATGAYGTAGTSASVAAPTGTGSVPIQNVEKSSSNSTATVAAAKSTATATGTADEGCTFTDADAAASSKTSCSNIILKDITVPAGETLDLTGLNDGTTVTFEGTTTFEYKEWQGPLISFSGSDITITGAADHVIDGNGAKWWDGKGSNGGKTKPKFFYAHKLIDSTISNLNIQNYPVQCFSVNGAENLYIKDVTIDNSAGDEEGSDGKALGHNTDAFDVGSSTGVYISGANVKNQDDCLAVNSGTDISFTGATCSGGHGISIGSVGGRDDNDVADIYIADSSISDSDNGVRIKTVYDATGSVNNVTYSGITLNNIAKYGIVIEQDYENGSPTGTPTDGVPITDITIQDVTGTVSDKGTEVYILCASCSSWTWSGVDITGGEKSTECEGIPDGASC